MIADTIRGKIETVLSPQSLEVIDLSHLHEGHAGARPEGETHFRVCVVAHAFGGLSRLDRQRHVLDLLAEELAGPVHALELKLMTPDEAAQ